MTISSETVITGVITGVILLIVGGVGTLCYDWYKSRSFIDVKLAYVGTKKGIHVLEESSNKKMMVYPFQVKVINLGNIPISVTEIATHQYIVVNQQAFIQPSLYKNTQEPYDESEIAPSASRVFNVRSYIEDSTITGSYPVHIQADLQIQGAGFVEKKASVFAYELKPNGDPKASNKPRVISTFE